MRSFLAGLGVGIGLGILFAPTSGRQTRSNIKDRANELAGTARETLEQGRDRMRSGISAMRGAAESAVEAAKQRTSSAGF